MKINVSDVISFTVQNCQITAKVEDASKGDVFRAKVETVSGDCSSYQPGGLYEFDRKLLG